MLKVSIICNPKPAILNLEAFKARIETGLGEIADLWGADTVGHIKEAYLSGPRGGDKLAPVTGYLRSSIRHRVTQSKNSLQVKFGTDVKYAAIHEFGGHTPAHVILPKKGGVLSFMMGGKRMFAKSVNHPGSKIPRRPFLRPGITDQLPAFKETIRAFLLEASNVNA